MPVSYTHLERHLISFFRRLMRYKVNVIATEYALNLKVPAYHMGTIIEDVYKRQVYPCGNQSPCRVFW